MPSYSPPGRWTLPVLLVALLSFYACGDDGDSSTPSNNNTPDMADNNADAPNNANAPNNADTPNNSSNGNNADAPFACQGEVKVTPDGAEVEATVSGNGDDLDGFFIRIGPGSVPAGTEVSVQCQTDDLVVEGYRPVSAPILVQGPAGVRGEPWEMALPFRKARLPEGINPQDMRIFLQFPNGDVRSPAFIDMQEDLEGGILSFDTQVFGIYQVMVPDNDAPRERNYTFRSITGVSMGAGGASMIGFRHPELFDIVGALGGSADWTYMAHYIRGGGMGGFCPEANPDDPTTWKCDTYNPTQEYEHGMTYDEWFSPTGDGTGGAFSREDYVEIFQDLSYAFGNMNSYNPDNPYLPAGVPLEEKLRTGDEVCPAGGMLIAEGYYDDEYNPNGDLPVITFCDGDVNQDTTLPFDRYCDYNPEDGTPDQPNRGLYTGGENQRTPFQIAVAVDYNRNGQRDVGEPVIRNFFENYEDVGADGLADEDEPGFDPATNPDPNGDNYHWSYNPGGSERNWVYDEGEPFEDFGLDGVEGTPQVANGGFDWGEGNGQFDMNPNLAELMRRNPRNALAALPDAERKQALEDLTLFADGGIRDLFNFSVASNQLAGAVQHQGGNVRVYDDFTELAQAEDYTSIDVTQINYKELGEHVHVRYGDPNADEEAICLGDGKHVGEVFQTINRLLIMLGFILNRTPDGDLTVVEPPYAIPSGTYWINSQGRRFKYSISMPPGYEYTQCSDGYDNDNDGLFDGEDPDCLHGDHNNESGPTTTTRCSDGIDNDADGLVDTADDGCDSPEDDSESEFFTEKRFPVIYLLHGYGQSPEDLRPSLVFLSGYMAGGFWPKAILAFPDGFCGENAVNQCNDGVDNDGDGMIDNQDDGCENSNSETGTDLAACNDGVDNDQDGLVDTDDHGCANENSPEEADCVQGTFYTDHVTYPDGTTPGPPYEKHLLDMIDHIDQNYRVRAPERLPIP